jgi:hemolysin activation/secretion protein
MRMISSKTVGGQAYATCLFGLWLSGAGTFALAQNVPDAGSLLRENQRPPNLPEAPHPAQAPQAAPAIDTTLKSDQVLRFQVSRIVIQGATLIPADDLQAIVKGWRNRDVSFADLRAAARAISDEYQRRGWYARAQLPAQELQNGQVRIEVIEARLGAVHVDDGGQKLRLDGDMLINTLTARQKPGEPLRLENIERAIGVLGDTPGVAVNVALAPGAAHGETDVVVHAKDQPLFAGSLWLDDHGARSSGVNRVSAKLDLDNPGGHGDQANLASVVGEGSQYLRLAYSLALGHDGLRVGANVSTLRYHLLNEFAVVDARGSANTVGLVATYPVLRTGGRKLMAAATLQARDYRDSVSGVEISRKNSTVLTASLFGDLSDTLGAGGFSLWALNLDLGRLDLSHNAANQAFDRAGPATEGDYRKLGWNLARMQHLSDQTSLWAAATGRFASKNLDSSEKFSLGGANGVRAYPALEANGDAGWLANLELIRQISPELQVFGFYDYGAIRLNQNPSSATALANGRNSYALKGYGLGLSWIRPNQFVLRATLARRDGSNPGANASNDQDNDGSKQLYRLWVSASAYF